MVFSSLLFLCIFLPLILILYFNPLTQKSIVAKNSVLLLMSLMFYGWGEPNFILIMLAVVAITWAIGLFMERLANYRKILLGVGISVHVGMLYVFKYYTFSCTVWRDIFGSHDSILQIALPIGISFFSFQLMSYLFDVYYGTAKVQKNVLNVALYIALFPQLIAGPIVRYQQIANELRKRSESLDDICVGFRRFIIGLGKKVLIANYMAQIADNMFVPGMELSVASAWLGAAAYTLQIFFDFSGYSDMAIGLGRMFGFHFPENFNYPYVAKSVTDFWRRWHMSLTNWFRDYVYIPLGGNRVSAMKWTRNIFMVWLLTGIWHGANWTFIAWGLLYFVVLMLEKTTAFHLKLGIFSRFYTLVVVIIAWVIFRSPDLQFAMNYLSTMFGVMSHEIVDEVFVYYFSGGKIVIIAAILFSTPIVPYIKEKISECFAWNIFEAFVLLGMFFLSFIQVISATYNPFIYFNF